MHNAAKNVERRAHVGRCLENPARRLSYRQYNYVIFSCPKSKDHNLHTMPTADFSFISYLIRFYFLFFSDRKRLHYILVIIQKTCSLSRRCKGRWIRILAYRREWYAVAMWHEILGCASARSSLASVCSSVHSIFVILDSFDRKCNLRKNETSAVASTGDCIILCCADEKKRNQLIVSIQPRRQNIIHCTAWRMVECGSRSKRELVLVLTIFLPFFQWTNLGLYVALWVGNQVFHLSCRSSLCTFFICIQCNRALVCDPLNGLQCTR